MWLVLCRHLFHRHLCVNVYLRRPFGVKRLQFYMFITLAAGAGSYVSMIRLHRALAHLEAGVCLMHLHLFGRLVSHRWLAWTSLALHLALWVLLLLADVSDGGVEVLPERLDARHVLLLAQLLISQSNLVSLVVYVRSELLLVNVVKDAAVRGSVLAASHRVSRTHVHGRFLSRAESTALLLLARG